MRTQYFVPLGRIADFAHAAPDRTAIRPGRAWDSEYECRIFPSRGAMLTACKMSDTGALDANRWKPVVKSA